MELATTVFDDALDYALADAVAARDDEIGDDDGVALRLAFEERDRETTTVVVESTRSRLMDDNCFCRSTTTTSAGRPPC